MIANIIKYYLFRHGSFVLNWFSIKKDCFYRYFYHKILLFVGLFNIIMLLTYMLLFYSISLNHFYITEYYRHKRRTNHINIIYKYDKNKYEQWYPNIPVPAASYRWCYAPFLKEVLFNRGYNLSLFISIWMLYLKKKISLYNMN